MSRCRESTVVQLKLASTLFFSSDCMTPAGSFASVKTKQSIVAMSGAIMPLPLAIPVIAHLGTADCAPYASPPWGRCPSS